MYGGAKGQLGAVLTADAVLPPRSAGCSSAGSSGGGGGQGVARSSRPPARGAPADPIEDLGQSTFGGAIELPTDVPTDTDWRGGGVLAAASVSLLSISLVTMYPCCRYPSVGR
jgi:hypothetical protein